MRTPEPERTRNRASPSAALRRAAAAELNGLAPDVLKALLVVAASHGAELRTVRRALEAMSLRVVDLAPAIRAGVVTVAEGRITWRDPLVRSMAYDRARAVDRRRAHRALAVALGGVRADAGAWQLAAAAIGMDRLLAVADWQLRQPTTGGEQHAPVAVRASEVDARAKVELARGTPLAALQLLLEEAYATEGTSPRRASDLLTEAASAAIGGGQVSVGVECAERAVALARRDASTPAGSVPHAVLAIGLAVAGRVREARTELAAAREIAARYDGADYASMVRIGQAAFWLEDYDVTAEQMGRAIIRARREYVDEPLAVALDTLAAAEFRTGRLAISRGRSADAGRSAAACGNLSEEASILTTLARIDSVLGAPMDAHQHLSRAADIADTHGLKLAALWVSGIGGLLDLLQGRPREAVAKLVPLSALAAESGFASPGLLSFVPDLVEAHLRIGERQRAANVLADFERQAIASDHRWGQAAAARCRALLAGQDEFEARFHDALEMHSSIGMPLERGRALLLFGESLRRWRRPRDAREQLRSAMSVFDDLGAVAWSARARSELVASGGAVRTRGSSPKDLLSPRELEVADRIADGASTREAAEALFVSVRTIDFHLATVYRKLGVRSRTQMAKILRAGVAH